MDLGKVLQQLHEELDNLNAAIASLERLQEAGRQRSKDQEWIGNMAGAARPGRKRRGRPEQTGELQEAEPQDETPTEEE